MKSQFFVLVVICLVCHILRSVYEILKYKNVISPENKIVFGFMFVNMSLLWISWFIMCELDPNRFVFPAWLRIAGLLLFIVGILLFIFTLIKMKALENYSGELIQDGLFSVLRHPMYMGFILWVIGYAVFQQAQTALLISIVWISNILFWRYIEEKQLEKKYSNYMEYKKKTIF